MFKIAAVPIKDQKGVCEYCKKIPVGGKNPLRKLCDEACKKASDYGGDRFLEIVCCSGVTRAPAAPCLKKLFEKGPATQRAVTACETCCLELDELKGNPSAQSLCVKACNGKGQGR